MFSSIPMGRFGTAEEVGWVVRFLASPEAGYVTGQTRDRGRRPGAARGLES